MNKIFKTLGEINKVAKHHYGDNSYSLLKFIYYSFLHVNIFKVFEIKLDNRLVEPGPIISEFKVITDLADLKKLRKDNDLPREFFYDEMHNISNFYMLIQGDEIAYIHWYYIKGDKSRFLSLDDYVAELNYNTTLPKFRGKGLMNHALRYILIDLKKKGFKRVCGVVNKENYPAIKSTIRAGFSEIAEIKAIGQFNRKMKV
jgi:hypothetical protein